MPYWTFRYGIYAQMDRQGEDDKVEVTCHGLILIHISAKSRTPNFLVNSASHHWLR
jgi:hypothetical protein